MRIAVLGCNGYLGKRLTSALAGVGDVEHVLGIARQAEPEPSISPSPRLHYARGDLAELPLSALLAEHRIDTIVHCAFISRPLRDAREAYRCNVVTTDRVFAAARDAGVKHAVLLSSVAVYGPRDSGELAGEQQPASPNAFVFSQHKVLQEHAAWQHSVDGGIALTIVRPCTVVGPGARNFLLDFFARSVIPVPMGHDPHWQFLHEDDFVSAVLALVRDRRAGIFNLAPDDTVRLRDAVRLLGGRPLPLPRWLLHAAVGVGWLLRLPFVPGPRAALAFLHHPPLVANTLFKQRTGYRLRHTSREAVMSLLTAAN